MFWFLLFIGYDHSVGWNTYKTEEACLTAPLPPNTSYNVCLPENQNARPEHRPQS